ncbi:MAG TPA: nitronate monooxygenase [Candidatus Kapabacteria bacterium]|nr:nitronate monooxygenase [Candidatus Kapabacteria bacterium]
MVREQERVQDEPCNPPPRMTDHPRIIQGGMGVAISGWQLARAVSRRGQLGVVSGTCMNAVFAQRLQNGDAGGHLRRAMEHFPVPSIAEDILRKHLNARRASRGNAHARRSAVRGVPMFTLDASDDLLQLTVAANFCEIFLAKEGHDGVIGINLLEKVQLPNLASLYGAMLAGVDYVLMGAGIPREIPGVLDKLARHEIATLKLDVEGATSNEDIRITFDPKRLLGLNPASASSTMLPTMLPELRMTDHPLRRPKFLAIVSSDVLAQVLVQKASGRIDGLVIENDLAGGHNAPPRGAMKLAPSGEPIYGPRDIANIDKVKALGLPFWLAGDCASPEQLSGALASGAAGIQVGTDFAFCEESGLDKHLRDKTLYGLSTGEVPVFTDPRASPTGFPFKVVQLPGTLSEQSVYDQRPRRCQLGFLRRAYKKKNGRIGYRCPGEPITSYLRKGGTMEDTIGRKCLCNALMANVGLAQEQSSGYIEKPLLTAGDSLARLKHYLKNGVRSYTASDVIDYLLS